MGQLLPIGCVPVLPGDMIGHHTNALVRVTPMAAPVMHQVDVRIHHFYVANRTLWDGWEQFITGGDDGMNTDQVPTIDAGLSAPGNLLDYLGIPPGSTGNINALPLYAANACYNEFYRDQDICPTVLNTDTKVKKIAWGKDYFTTARPWTHKGPAVTIPIGDKAEIHTDNSTTDNISIYSTTQQAWRDINSGATANDRLHLNGSAGSVTRKMYADLTSAAGADPIDVRKAWGLQRFMENAARFGNRYPEKMRQLGSTYRGLMDRPLYLGGGSQAISFSEVLQTAPEAAAQRAFGVGDLYGHGIAPMRTNKYAHKCQEHGYIMSFLSARPKSIYQAGIEREFLKRDREDFHDPYLEFVGQQEVWNGELDGSHTTPYGTFGYSDRYEEYRGHPSNVCGEFRDTLDYWHMGRKYDLQSPPVLNQDFIECTPTKRIYNEQTQHPLWIMVSHRIAAHRNIARTSTPRLF